MRFWPALALALVLGPLEAAAGPVAVTSGEHPGFTRLVLKFGSPVLWQVGRALDGYTLRVQNQRPTYNMAKAFDLIGKSRLAALSADPTTGDLHLGIACTCYAMPFELRPGTVVVDLYDGAPPKGSSFEQPIDSPVAVVEAPFEIKLTPALPTYDWTKVALGPVAAEAPLNPALATTANDGLLAADPSLEPLRLSLIEEMSRGASQGIVDMAKPKKMPRTAATPGPSVQIHLGETPGLVIRQKGSARLPLTAQGAACLSDDQLDLPAWGASRPISDQIGPERQGLTGEFDRPDPDAVTRAIRFQLFLGFGAEATSLARSFPGNLADTPIWQSMAHILDGEPDPTPAFLGMEECGGTAALWATLANPNARPTEQTGKSAVLRSFSALPPHLRKLLGPRLVDRFLAANDISVATALRDAVLRAPGDPGPGIVLMLAAMDRALGKPGRSEAKLEPLASASGPAAADALVDLVEQRAALGQSIGYDQVQTLEGLLKEREGSAAAPRYRHALLLAHAASGDFDTAFAEIPQAPDATATLWQVLALAGPDSALLAHATLAATDPLPAEAKGAASLIADRMLGLGLADQAARWLLLDDTAPDLLKARTLLAQGQPEAALSILQTDQSSPALSVKADALQAMGDQKAAADLYATMGKPDLRWSALNRSQSWDSVAQDGPDPWKAVAAIVVPVAQSTTGSAVAEPLASIGVLGPIARNKALVQDSAATRDAITALLDAVKSPVSPTQ